MLLILIFLLLLLLLLIIIIKQTFQSRLLKSYHGDTCSHAVNVKPQKPQN